MSRHLKSTLSTVLAAGLLASSVLISPVSAQYAGPTADDLMLSKVADILQNPKDDVDVTLKGHLLRKVGDEDYIFSDGSGEIVVEIDDDDFPRQRVDEKTLVEIKGEVDTSRHRPPEIDVDKVRVLK